MLIYLLKVNFLLLVFTLAYWLLLRKGELLQLNRLILVTGILLAFVLPTLPTLTSFTESMPRPLQELSGRASSAIPGLELEAPTAPRIEVSEEATTAPLPPPEESWPPRYALWGILAVSASLLFLVIRQFLRIFKLIIYSSNERREGLTVVHTDEDVPPFAFFRYLVINPENYQGQALHQIIVHEKVHIRQHHYLDILLAEFLRIICWYNPAVWLLNRLLKMNLEYIADREVLSAGIDRKSYQYQLLEMSVRGQSLRLTTPMNYSPIKMRITMMNAKKTSFLAQLKYALLLPVCGLALMVISPVQAQAVEVNITSSSTSSPTTVVNGTASGASATTVSGEAVATTSTMAKEDIYFVIRPNTKRKSLMDAQALLAEKGIVVKYHNLNFNDGLLTAISISITSNNYNGNLSYDPLEKALVFYDLRIGERKTGFEYGTPRQVSLKERDIIDNVSGLLVRDANGRVEIRGTARID